MFNIFIALPVLLQLFPEFDLFCADDTLQTQSSFGFFHKLRLAFLGSLIGKRGLPLHLYVVEWVKGKESIRRAKNGRKNKQLNTVQLCSVNSNKRKRNDKEIGKQQKQQKTDL